ncbi:MAG: recombination regulator RecX [Phycisphaera sp.]|nr:MAG: recombination regulator RecX [Phycisphaera sp.]
MEEPETITLVSRGPNRWKLVTPDHKNATLDDAAVVDGQLVSGDPWTPAIQERVRQVLAEAGARIAAGRLLRVRPRSSAELRERLGKRFPKEAVDRAVDALVRSGAVDDARLADDLAEQLGGVKPHGREAIRDRLERAKLGAEMLEEALDAHAPSTGEGQRAVDAARAQLKRLQALSLTPEAMRRRMFGVLARRGFDAETAAEAIEQVLGTADDEVF